MLTASENPNRPDLVFIAIVLVMALLLAVACDSSESCPVVQLGDVTMDGEIGPADAGMIWNHVMGYRRLSKCSVRAADYNGDGRLTESDADAVFAAWLGGAKRWPSFRAYLAERCAQGDPMPDVPVCP